MKNHPFLFSRERRCRATVLQIGAVHELHTEGVRSAAIQLLLHNVAYYTLWNFVE